MRVLVTAAIRLGGYGLPRALFDDLLADVRGDLLVGLELHRVVGAPLSVGAQVGGIAEHLRERHAGGHHERVAAALLALDAAATAGEVADHVAEEVLGRDDLYREDRLEQYGLGAF